MVVNTAFFLTWYYLNSKNVFLFRVYRTIWKEWERKGTQERRNIIKERQGSAFNYAKDKAVYSTNLSTTSLFYNATDVVVLWQLLQVTESLPSSYTLFVILSNYSFSFCSRGDLINVTFIIFVNFFSFYSRTLVWNEISEGTVLFSIL